MKIGLKKHRYIKLAKRISLGAGEYNCEAISLARGEYNCEAISLARGEYN